MRSAGLKGKRDTGDIGGSTAKKQRQGEMLCDLTQDGCAALAQPGYAGGCGCTKTIETGTQQIAWTTKNLWLQSPKRFVPAVLPSM